MRLFSVITCAAFGTLCVAAQAQENLLNIYSSRHYQTDEALYANFTKTTGIKLNRIEAGEDPLIERLKNEGASSPVAAFISFVPKVQGFVTLIVLLGTVGWSANGDSSIPPVIAAVLWMIAVLTMTLGNIGALLQRSAKRMLAYSSIANSGYMLVGILAGPTVGIDATLLYLLTYGVANLATFGSLAAIERNGHEVDSIDDLAGLRVRAPMVAAALAIGALSLTGIPPLLGFWGKLDLFVASAESHQRTLLVIMALNSGVAAFYYLRLVAMPFVQEPTPRTQGVSPVPSVWPRLSALIFAAGCIALPFFANQLKGEAAAAARTDLDKQATVAQSVEK